MQTYLNSRHFLQFDFSIYKNIKIIEPGEIIEIDNSHKIKKLSKFNIHDLVSEKIFNKNLKRTENDILDELNHILKKY